MYPRNAASPERISIGAVVQISDGAVQTSGVTVRILPFGGSEADGAGTVAYSTDGVVVYTPTQAETNYTSFVLIAKKTGCIPANVTVVTSESTVSGRVYVATNNDKIGYTATVSDKTGFSLTPATGLGNQTANITGNLSGAVGSVTGSVGSVASYGTLVSDIATAVWSAGTRTLTGFGTLVNDIATAVWEAGTRTLTAFGFNVNLTPSTGLGAQNGSVALVTKVEELGANAFTANSAGDEVADAVWDAPYNQHTTAGSFGKLMDILRKANTLIEGTVTSAVSPTSTAFTSNVNYPTGAFKHAVLLWVTGNLDEQNSPILTYNNTNGAITVEEAFTAAPQVGDEFVIIPTTHVHSVAAIAQGVAGTQVMTDLATMIINDGTANARYSISALQNAPAGEGGGGQTINVYPVSASTPERVAGTTITYYRNEIRSVSVVTDFTLTALTLQFVIEDSEGADLLTVPDGSISRSDKTFTVSIGTAVTATISNYRWALRDITGGSNSVIARGVLTVQEAASA